MEDNGGENTSYNAMFSCLAKLIDCIISSVRQWRGEKPLCAQRAPMRAACQKKTHNANEIDGQSMHATAPNAPSRTGERQGCTGEHPPLHCREGGLGKGGGQLD